MEGCIRNVFERLVKYLNQLYFKGLLKWYAKRCKQNYIKTEHGLTISLFPCELNFYCCLNEY